MAQFFCPLLFQIWKKHTSESENTLQKFLLIAFSNIKKACLQILKFLAQFFISLLFKILKKAYLRILRIPATVFLFIAFSNIKKKHTYDSSNFWHNCFAHRFFKYEKSILQNLKIPFTIFLLIAISNIKKAYLRIWKFLAQFFADGFFKY